MKARPFYSWSVRLSKDGKHHYTYVFAQSEGDARREVAAFLARDTYLGWKLTELKRGRKRRERNPMTELDWAVGAMSTHLLGKYSRAMFTPKLDRKNYQAAVKILKAHKDDPRARELLKEIGAKNPSVSARQRRFMGAELGRLRRGERTETGMTEKQLRGYARKPKNPKSRRHTEPLCICGHQRMDHSSEPPSTPPYTPERRSYGKCGYRLSEGHECKKYKPSGKSATVYYNPYAPQTFHGREGHGEGRARDTDSQDQQLRCPGCDNVFSNPSPGVGTCGGCGVGVEIHG